MAGDPVQRRGASARSLRRVRYRHGLPLAAVAAIVLLTSCGSSGAGGLALATTSPGLPTASASVAGASSTPESAVATPTGGAGVGAASGANAAPASSTVTTAVPSVSLTSTPVATVAIAGAAVATPSASNAQPPSNTTPHAASTEQPVAAEQNPPGDIPDTQAFVSYKAVDGGYQLDVPEGWARSGQSADVSFIDKLDGLRVTVTSASAAPSAASARTREVAAMEQSGRAVQVKQVRDEQFASGHAVVVDYTANSDPSPVTGKQVRLENNAYLFFQNGKLATITLWAPLGADNVDQWQRIGHSFRWL